MSLGAPRRDRVRTGLAALGLVAVPLTVASLTGVPKLGAPGSSSSPPGSVVPIVAESPAPDACRLPPLDLAGPLACASAILVEARTGAVLFEQAADSARAPASLAKMMLEVLAFEDIASRRISVADSVLVSERAAGMGGATVEVVPGERVALGDLLEAVVLVSANDAAVAVAEHLAGSEPAFVLRMNERAAALGCSATSFVNCHGLDMPPEESVSCARDLATIARRLLELPDALRLASIPEASFRGGELSMRSTNELLGVLEGVDGLKTGFTARAGGCFCGTIERDGVRFVSVVLGAAPGTPRFEITQTLYECAYRVEPRWVDASAHEERAGSGGASGRVLLAGARETR